MRAWLLRFRDMEPLGGMAQRLVLMMVIACSGGDLWASEVDPCEPCEEWDASLNNGEGGCVPIEVEWTEVIDPCPSFELKSMESTAYCASVDTNTFSLTIGAPPIINRVPGKKKLIPEPPECGEATEDQFEYEDIEWEWFVTGMENLSVEPTEGEGEEAVLSATPEQPNTPWALTVLFVAKAKHSGGGQNGGDDEPLCSLEVDGTRTMRAEVASISVTPFLGIKWEEDYKGKRLKEGPPDRGVADIADGLPGGNKEYSWGMVGVCAFDPAPPPNDSMVEFVEQGTPSSAFLDETIFVTVTSVVEGEDGTETYSCTQRTNFTVVAVDVSMAVVLCGSENEKASEPVTLAVETANLPPDHEVQIYATVGSYLFEDQDKTTPAKGSYSVEELPITLYHDTYMGTDEEPGVPLGSQAIFLRHVGSVAEYEISYDIIAASMTGYLPRSGPEVPPELRNDYMALLIPVAEIEEGQNPSTHPDAAELELKKKHFPPAGKLVLEYDDEAMTLYASDGGPVASGSEVDIENPTGPLAQLVGGTLKLYALGKAPQVDVAITLQYVSEAGGCVLAEHKASVFKLDWYIDAENKHGSEVPPRDPNVDTEAEPGKFVPVNRTDEDGDGIPDYADMQVTDQRAVIPTLLVIEPDDLDWGRLNVRVRYAGLQEPLDLSALSPQPIRHKGQLSGFTNYLNTLETYNVRLWSIDNRSASRTPEKYVVTERIYTARELKENFDGEGTFWIEGLRPCSELFTFEITAISEIDEEHVLTEDKVSATVFEAKLGLNTSNDHNDDKLRPGIPDVEFIIDEYDETVKDQGDGFTWWWSRDSGPQVTHSGIVDLFPVAVNIPGSLLEAGFEAYMSHSGDGSLALYPAPESKGDRRAHLKDPGIGERQLDQSPSPIRTVPMPVPVANGDEWQEFLMRAIGSGESTFTVTLWLKDNGDNFVPADSWRVTVKNTDQFWAFYSARDKAQGTLGYRVEDERVVSSDFYNIPRQIGGHRDPAKSKHLVMVHGFNNSVVDARLRYNEVWRRIYWLGFRGQFVGVTWHGNVGLLDELTPWNNTMGSAVRFDPSTRNAFQTAVAMTVFLHGEVLSWAGGAHNVDVMAHSLGNLLVWEAMRQYQLTGQGGGNTLIRNLISIEAAVWPEIFHEEGEFAYTAEPNPDNNIAYTVDEQKEHSWRSWSNKLKYPAGSSVGGAVYHSYVPDDNALVGWMRGNDWFWRGVFDEWPSGSRNWHYARNKLQSNPPEWRAPEGMKQTDAGWGEGQGGKSVKNRFHDRIPTWIKEGHRHQVYLWTDLNEPVGAIRHPLALGNSMNATENGRGWRAGYHSDFAVGEKGDANADMWFPKIWKWYEQFLGPAISTEEE